MELKFIWIEDYKNIKKTGFNFNHSIEQEFQFINDEIIISESVKTPKKFFTDNILGVTAIVGKNGSGKTNLGEFINYNLAHVTNGSLSTYFEGYKGILIIDKYIYIQESIKINNIEVLEKIGYEILSYENAPLDKQGGRKWAEMSNNKYIYYSSFFEFRYINMRDNLFNISTSYLAFNDVNISTRHYNQLDNFFNRNSRNTDTLTAYHINEMMRESDFILNYDSKKYIDVTPTDFILSIDSPKENRLLQSLYISSDETNMDIINQKKLWTELENLENYIWNYGYPELENYKLPKTTEGEPYDYYQIPIENKKDIFRRLFLIYLFKILVNTNQKFEQGYFRQFIYEEIQSDHEIEGKLNNINEKLELFIEKCDWQENKIGISRSNNYQDDDGLRYFDLIRNARINISDSKTRIVFLELLKLTNEITQNRIHFHYQFLNRYSSGQQNLLNFYSRFFWAKNELLISEKKDTYQLFKKRIIIFIDEGEVALHPEWQRLFFDKVINFLSDLFKDREVQLILTTHSPFVLSDVPKENVIFLERDENGYAKISDIERENTFGANIYSLLSDSFFMENTIGAFAEKKMKWALEILKSGHNDYSKDEIHELNYIIDSIGEPIIKEQFEYLFNIKFGNDEVADLKKTIIDLKKQLKKEEDDSDKN